MGGGLGELDDLFGGEPWSGEGRASVSLRGRTTGGAGGLATGSGAGTTAVGAVGSEGVEGKTQSSRVPLVRADGGVAAIPLVLTSIPELLWGR